MKTLLEMQLEVNKPFFYGSAMYLILTILLSSIFSFLKDTTVIFVLGSLFAFLLLCPILLFPVMMIRMIRFLHRIGSHFQVDHLFGKLTCFFMLMYMSIAGVTTILVSIAVHRLPLFTSYVQMFDFQIGENIVYWVLAFCLTVLTSLGMTWIVTIVYMLFRSQFMSHLSWWWKLCILVGIAIAFFLVVSWIFQMIAAIFPSIPIVPLSLTPLDDQAEYLSISAVQVLLQLFYVYVLIKVSAYIYLGMYESEY